MVTLAISMDTFFGGFLSLFTSFSGGPIKGVQLGVSGGGEGVFGGDHSHS